MMTELQGLHPHPFLCANLPMWINLSMSNIDRNHWIANQWGGLLTNARYSIFNVNGNQGTLYILTVMNRFFGVEWTVEFTFKETLMNFLSRWQGCQPLRHAGSRVPKNVSSFIPKKCFEVDRLKLVGRRALINLPSSNWARNYKWFCRNEVDITNEIYYGF